jgi:tripartite-type tricarboxylate transporter receptor subunit TctC
MLSTPMEGSCWILSETTSTAEIGHPLFTAPGVPADRVATLRKAFDESMRDPDFLKQAEAMKADVSPVSGDQLQKTVAEIVTTPKAAAARLTSIIGALGL